MHDIYILKYKFVRKLRDDKSIYTLNTFFYCTPKFNTTLPRIDDEPQRYHHLY